MKSDQRNIPVKNYILLSGIIILTVLVTVFSNHFYQEKNQYNIQNNNTMEFLSEIKKEEWDNYISENHDAIVYISSSTDNQNKKFELKLKKYINEKNLTKDFVYLDAANLDNNFYQHLSEKYLSSKIKNQNLKTIPNIFVIKDKKIVHVLYTKTPNQFNNKKVQEFLKKNWIEEQ